jgi:hypothetical protein
MVPFLNQCRLACDPRDRPPLTLVFCLANTDPKRLQIPRCRFVRVGKIENEDEGRNWQRKEQNYISEYRFDISRTCNKFLRMRKKVVRSSPEKEIGIAFENIGI